MTNLIAIAQADELRPNSIDMDTKNNWLKTLEADFCETMEIDMPSFEASEAVTLSMPEPYDQAYVLYLAAMIDNYNQETILFQNDKAMSNIAVADAKAWWRRGHIPTKYVGVKI